MSNANVVLTVQRSMPVSLEITDDDIVDGVNNTKIVIHLCRIIKDAIEVLDKDRLAEFREFLTNDHESKAFVDLIYEFKDRWEKLKPMIESPLVLSVYDIDLSLRSRRAMIKLKIETVGELINKVTASLLSKIAGSIVVLEVKEKLAKLGVELRKY